MEDKLKPRLKPERQRLSIDLEPGQRELIAEVFPWGTQRYMVTAMLQIFLNFLTKNTFGSTYEAMRNGRLKLIILCAEEDEKDGDYRRPETEYTAPEPLRTVEADSRTTDKSAHNEV